MSIPVIAIFDIGKTNKKLLLFDESYTVIFEKSSCLPETRDEDGDPCESIEGLNRFAHESMEEVLRYRYYRLKAVNFSAYGASLVLLDEKGKPVCPLYNYLKTYPKALQDQFYNAYGGASSLSHQTASPVLGSLNSGMQLYRLKYERPEFFHRVRYALHLPQYLSFLLTGQAFSEITSIGCHTNLWNFQAHGYHEWVSKENMLGILPPVVSSDHVVRCQYQAETFKAGVGLHDSSAALIPYLKSFSEPFVLISTGTWCITLNPFNHSELTTRELESDCLCYLSYTGRPVKASRLFSGHVHDEQLSRMASHFNKTKAHFESTAFRADLIPRLRDGVNTGSSATLSGSCAFAGRDLSDFENGEEAYHQLIYDLVCQQHHATQLVMRETPVKTIFVDGGFSRNSIFMNLMAMVFPQADVYATSMPQGSALGSAMAIHRKWNSRPEPKDLMQLNRYPKPEVVA